MDNDTENFTEHLVVVQPRDSSDATLFERLLASPFSLGKALPVPPELARLDELDAMHHFLAFGQVDKAYGIANELGLDWPFNQPSPGSIELREYLRQNPEVAKTAVAVSKTLRSTGHVSVRSWKAETWGSTSDIKPVSWEVETPGMATLRFKDPASRQHALLSWGLGNPKLHVQAIIVDFNRLQQTFLDTSRKGVHGAAVQLRTEKFEDRLDLEQASWLKQLPAQLGQFA